ncbi:putative signal transducing protein [Limnoglobus roseus]|uniref:Uncharacterized protein n=1 Tax=Limnoglobus roseus TaxID=2598579 RepID=A0A5C1A7C9_9BACT|nr:DUF2007 domain-containing protein [Limnoglobus roseus]QEL14355.1 hypothetical protein PX52LOC_01243 [Limnoglobus roseus]
MADRLVTIATFDSVPQAHLAKNELDTAGIRSVLMDEETVGMLWHAAHAIGGIKLKVNEEDAERALVVFDERFGNGGESSDPVDEQSLAEQALAVPREDEDPSEGLPHPESVETPAADSAPPDPVGGYREECARRLFFVAWLGFLFPPLIFYAFYLMLNAALGSGELSRQGRVNVLVGSLVTLVGLPMAWLMVMAFLPGRLN